MAPNKIKHCKYWWKVKKIIIIIIITIIIGQTFLLVLNVSNYLQFPINLVFLLKNDFRRKFH
ncbi:MAG: hypothetical protein N7Q72_05395, partial [Spiroplasma sp. Tabriz.8]|nr:hypothetical protein [Spiroplasma sp. Tabriz.8]